MAKCLGNYFLSGGMKELLLSYFSFKYPLIYKIGVNLCLFFSKQRFFAKSTWQLSVESAFFKFFNLKSF